MKKLCERLLLLAVMIFALNMDSQSDKRSVALEPSYAPLQTGQGSFIAEIYDGSVVVQVEDLSFFGLTSLGHIKSEDNDSVCEFDLAEIVEIEVVKAHFDSTRFSDQVFTKIKVSTLSHNPDEAGRVNIVDGLLIPRNIIICGKERTTGIKRAWFISKINRIVVQHASQPSSSYYESHYKNKVAKGAKKKTAKSTESLSSRDAGPQSKVSDQGRELAGVLPGVISQEKESATVQSVGATQNSGAQDEPRDILSAIKAFFYAIYILIRSLFTGIINLV